VSRVGSPSVVLLDARLPSDISLCTSSSFSASVFPETIVEPIRSAPRYLVNFGLRCWTDTASSAVTANGKKQAHKIPTLCITHNGC
jgi:hypothetical protein